MLKYNICVVGTGYVGLSNAVLFARQHNVTSLDVDAKRVEQSINGFLLLLMNILKKI